MPVSKKRRNTKRKPAPTARKKPALELVSEPAPPLPDRRACTDRGQGLQVFGDMGNSFDCAISHVELRDLAACEDHLPYSVLSGWHQSDRVSGERLGQFEDLALEADAAFVLDAADLMFGRVLDGRQGLGEGTRTGSEPGGRHVQVEGLVGPLAVVDDAPAVEGPLAVPEIAEGRTAQQFGLQRAVEALVLAQRLRMIGTAVTEADAEAQQPDAERRVRRVRPSPQGEPLSTMIHSGRP